MNIDLNDPIAVLLAVVLAFEKAAIEAAAYGGLALAMYGEPRETKDADLAVTAAAGTAGEAALRAAGFNVVLAFDRVRFGGQYVSRLTLIGGEAGSLNTADLVEPRSSRYARAAMARSLTGTLREQPIRVLSPEDFIVMKILPTRDRDLEDAASVIRALTPRLDMEMIDREIDALQVEIPDHEIRNRWRRTQQIVQA
jgi:hypothetical protein